MNTVRLDFLLSLCIKQVNKDWIQIYGRPFSEQNRITQKQMQVHRGLDNFKAINPVVTIGTFDGVHLGHQKVISRLREIAGKHRGESVIFTFYPHPRLITSPYETNLRLLTTLEEKIVLFENLGIDHLIIYPFDKEFSELSYEEFVRKILVDRMNTHCLVVGYDHKFGKNREGGFNYLKECAVRYGFKIEKLEVLSMKNENVSSTIIRKALQEGDIVTANHFLGYRFTLHGTVVSGKKLGRELGFPTANIESSDKHKIIPGYGVYAVQSRLGSRLYNGMLNIGTRPTFNKNADNRSIEVHLFDFSEEIYGKEITLFFVNKIRDEQKFNNIEDLVARLYIDKSEAKKILST